MKFRPALISLFATLLLGSWSHADDWPQWLGPRGDAHWTETGVVEEFPAEGLSVRWRVPVSWGYAGPAVVEGRVYLTDYVPSEGEIVNNPGGRERLQGEERVLCFDAATGQTIWQYKYPCEYHISYPGGPRCTPSVSEGLVYALGAEGDLVCLNAADGQLIWKKNFVRDFDAPTPLWGVSAHPLVIGDQVVCLVGGEGTAVVAFDKRTGRRRWAALDAKDAGYCPASVIEHAGVRQLIIWLPDQLCALDPVDGSVYWTVPLKPNYGMSIMAPRKSGDYLFASGHGHTGALMKLGADPSDIEVVWGGKAGRGVYCSNSTPQIVEGILYGCDVNSGALVAARLEDGEILWTTHEPTTGSRRGPHGTAFLIRHGDRFFLMSETGNLILAKLSAEKYEELGRFQLLEPTNECFGRKVVWSHPACAERCLFARNDQELVCVELGQ
jgi:outer membrane protein assembly factor BamB